MASSTGNNEKDILHIKYVSVRDGSGKKYILKDVSAHVQDKGITAVLGPSASGKTVLLKTLAGFNKTLPVSGQAELFGKTIDFKKGSREASYVPKEDRLIGDLTALETLLYSIRMRTTLNKAEAVELAEQTLKQLGLYHVKDSIVGTIIKRGLSGGEKRRLAVAVEFCVRPRMLYLDEPTSGLDTAAAVTLAQTLRNAAADDGQRLRGVLLSIHQPNSELLALFDSVLVLGQAGAPTYFGPVAGVGPHFARCGFPLPAGHTPTDFVLEVTSPHRHSPGRGTDFYAAWTMSQAREALVDRLEGSGRTLPPAAALAGKGSLLNGDGAAAAAAAGEAGFWRRVFWIVHREFVLAKRDPTLYWFQLAMNSAFGFFVGATFYDMPWKVDASMGQINGGVLWLLMIVCYMHIFKATYLDQQNKRCELEQGNSCYTVFTNFVADTFSVTVLNLYQWSCVFIAYFMCGYPVEAFGETLLFMMVMALSAEALAKIITALSPNTAYTVVLLQCVIIAMNVFPAGIVITKDHVPDWWVWAEELSLFVRSYETTLAALYNEMTFDCPEASVFADGTCLNFGVGDGVFPCDAAFNYDTLLCEVDGRTALEVQTGISKHKKTWNLFAYMMLYYVALKALALASNYVDIPEIIASLKYKCCGKRAHAVEEETGTGARRLRYEGESSSGGAAATAARKAPDAKGSHKPTLKRPSSSSSSSGPEPAEDEEQGGGAAAAAATAAGEETKAGLVVVDPPTDLVASSRKGRQQGAAAAAAAAADGPSTSLRRPSLGESGRQKSSFKRATSSNLYFEGISVTLKKKKNPKVLVNEVTACARGGRPLFLMGPSGAGKTTLLNALSGRLPYAEVTGKILLDGEPVARDRLAYVEQFEEILPVFTIREHLYYRGRLMGIPEELLGRRIDELLEILGFSDKHGWRTGRLTTGELKRVSVGLGMVAKPDVLFLDEPTTGLDSDNSASVMKYVAKVAHHTGTVTVCTIHQPSRSVFDLSEDFLLLAQGRTAYFGTTAGCAAYFEALLGRAVPREVNPADFYLNLLQEAPRDHGVEAEGWEELYPDRVPEVTKQLLRVAANGEQGKRESPAGRATHAALAQLGVLTRKTMTFYWREPAAYPLRGAELVGVALFLGTIFLRVPHRTGWLLEISGAFFWNIWCAVFACLAAAPTYCVVRRQVLQEVLAGAYPMHMANVAQAVASFVYNGAIALVYQAIMHYLVGFNDAGGVFGYFVAQSWQLLLMFDGLVLMVCELLKHDVLAVTLGMLCMGFFMLYAGFFVQIEDMPPVIGTWLPYLLPFREHMAGAVNNIFGSIDIKVDGSDEYLDREYIIEEVFGYPMASKWNFFAINFAWIVAMRLAHYGLCLFTLRSYK